MLVSIVKNLIKNQSVVRALVATLCIGAASTVMAAEHKHHHDHHDHNHAPAQAHVHGEAELNVVIDGEQVLVEFLSPLENLLGFEHKPQNTEQRQAVEELQQQLADYRTLFLIADAQCEQTQQHNVPPFSDESEAHAEWHGEYQLSCNNIDQAGSLQPQLFSHYPGVEKLTVQLISAKGQAQFIVSKDSDPIPLR